MMAGTAPAQRRPQWRFSFASIALCLLLLCVSLPQSCNAARKARKGSKPPAATLDTDNDVTATSSRANSSAEPSFRTRPFVCDAREFGAPNKAACQDLWQRVVEKQDQRYRAFANEEISAIGSGASDPRHVRNWPGLEPQFRAGGVQIPLYYEAKDCNIAILPARTDGATRGIGLASWKAIAEAGSAFIEKCLSSPVSAGGYISVNGPAGLEKQQPVIEIDGQDRFNVAVEPALVVAIWQSGDSWAVQWEKQLNAFEMDPVGRYPELLVQ